MYSKQKKFLIPIIFFAAIAGFSLIVMLLWNAVMPDIFNLPVISYLQALLLLLLARILFGGSPFRKYHTHTSEFHEKMKNMTPEEREAFREKLKQMRKTRWHCQPETKKTDTDNG